VSVEEQSNYVNCMNSTAGWVLLTFGNERAYAGNSGYADDLKRVYRYDSFVPNHRQLGEGDIVLLRDKNSLQGMARISRIQQEQGTKERRRCQVCRTTEMTPRVNTGDFRCRNGHTFQSPRVSFDPCTHYEAYFGTSFVAVPGALSISELRAACPAYNKQLAMQRIDLSMVASQLASGNPAAAVLLEGGYAEMNEGVPDLQTSTGGYILGRRDTREEVMRTIRARRGQQRFRENLRRRYGDACMISGCGLMDVVEAAHILPFRGTDDNHPENGLLLRADLHTLFDLDLLGIEPDQLRVHLHPHVAATGYRQFGGARLHHPSSVRPSRDALKSRWELFRTRGGSTM